MANRMIHFTLPEKRLKDIENCLREWDPRDWWVSGLGDDDERMQINILTGPEGGQDLLDKLQEEMNDEDDWRIVVLPLEAHLPRDKSDEAVEERRKARTTATREEIYSQVSSDASLNQDFIIMTVLSTLVAAIGLNEDNVAVVIGAMVIAPLLGPVIAFSLGTALGDRPLVLESAKSALLGVGAGMGVAAVMGMLINVNNDSELLTGGAGISLGTLILALASGGAAALSVATRKSSALVGVMVAVALLPPAAGFGLLMGAGEYSLALRPLGMVTLNVICIIIAAQVVFVLKGIKPRTWLERRRAESSRRFNLIVWAFLLVVAAGLIIAGRNWPELFPYSEQIFGITGD